MSKEIISKFSVDEEAETITITGKFTPKELLEFGRDNYPNMIYLTNKDTVYIKGMVILEGTWGED